MNARVLLAVLLLVAPPAMAQLGPPTPPTLPGGTPTLTPPTNLGQPPTVRTPVQILAPLAPTLESVTALAVNRGGSPPAPDQDAIVSVVLGNLGDAESFEITAFGSDCGWLPPPTLAQSRDHSRSQRGSAFGSFNRYGVFLSRNVGGCPVSVTLRMKRAGLAPEPPITLTSAPIALTGGRRVTIQATGQFVSRLGFRNVSPSVGVCSGSSTGTLPGSRTYTVGVNAASDFRFTVRSGPIGTYCIWDSEPFELPQGVRLVEMLSYATASDVAMEGEPPGRRATCGVEGTGEAKGDAIFSRGNAVGRPSRTFDRGTKPFPIGRYTTGSSLAGELLVVSGYPPLLTADNVILVPDDARPTQYRSVLQSLRLELECAPTGTNDHHAELTIERLIFFVPDNVTGFP